MTEKEMTKAERDALRVEQEKKIRMYFVYGSPFGSSVLIIFAAFFAAFLFVVIFGGW